MWLAVVYGRVPGGESTPPPQDYSRYVNHNTVIQTFTVNQYEPIGVIHTGQRLAC
jgi:hypothetical protein